MCGEGESDKSNRSPIVVSEEWLGTFGGWFMVVQSPVIARDLATARLRLTPAMFCLHFFVTRLTEVREQLPGRRRPRPQSGRWQATVAQRLY